MLVYVQVQCYLYKKYFGYAANAYYLMILQFYICFSLRPNEIICCQSFNLAVKFEPQTGNKFSYEIIFTGILFPYPRIKEFPGKDPLSII